MDFLVIGRDGADPDAPARRQAARERHLEVAGRAFLRGEWLSAAALLDPSENMVGSVIACRYPTREALDQWLEQEPYVLGNVWAQVEVIPIRFPGAFGRLQDLRRIDSTLERVDGEFSVCRLAPGTPLPSWLRGWYSVTSTSVELSIVCASPIVPDGVQREDGWALLSLTGPIPFETTGVVAGLTQGLAVAGIGVFVVSTFDTDHLLVKAEQVEEAVRILKAAGATFR
ncbi:MAG: ACT domain-containing protein [Myxococcota bacterium]